MAQDQSCSKCIHNRICNLWRKAECQDASSYSDRCFKPKQKPVKPGKWIMDRDYRNMIQCPFCYYLVNNFDYAFCPMCGKPFDDVEVGHVNMDKAWGG